MEVYTDVLGMITICQRECSRFSWDQVGNQHTNTEISDKYIGKGRNIYDLNTQRDNVPQIENHMKTPSIIMTYHIQYQFHSHLCDTWCSIHSLYSAKVLTLCQSGRWNTLGGKGRLNPCALCHHTPKRRKKWLCPGMSVSVCLTSSFPLSYFSFSFVSIDLWFSLHSFSLFCFQTWSPSTGLSVVSHSQFFSLSLRLTSCHSHVSQRATGPLAAFEVLSVVTSWLCDKGLQAKPGPHEYPATLFEWPLLPRQPSWHWIGSPLSQWELVSHWGRWMLGI